MPSSGQARADIAYGLVIALVAAAMFVHTYSDRYDNEFLFGDVSTVFFPRLLLAVIIALAVGLALKGVRGTAEGDFPPINIGRVALTYGVALVTAAGVWFVGYLIAMPVGVFLAGLALGYPNRIVLGLASISAPLIVWLVLARFAQVSFPTGTLF